MTIKRTGRTSYGGNRIVQTGGVQFAAEVGEMGVEDVWCAVPVLAPHSRDEFLSEQYLAGLFGHGAQDFELRLRECDRGIAHRDLVSGEVQAECADRKPTRCVYLNFFGSSSEASARCGDRKPCRSQ